MNTPEIRWNQHPLVLLSEEELKAHSKEWAFVLLSFVAPDTYTSLEEYLSHKTRWTLESTRRIESNHTIESIQQDGQFLTFLFQSPSAALDSALDLLMIHQHHHLFHH